MAFPLLAVPLTAGTHTRRWKFERRRNHHQVR
jgi:hypothetical protein